MKLIDKIPHEAVKLGEEVKATIGELADNMIKEGKAIEFEAKETGRGLAKALGFRHHKLVKYKLQDKIYGMAKALSPKEKAKRKKQREKYSREHPKKRAK